MIAPNEGKRAEAIASLREEEARLVEADDKLRGQLSEVQNELKEIRTAIAVLEGRKTTRNKREGSGAGFRTAEVVEIVISLIGEGVVEAEVIKDRVSAIAGERGKTRKGLHIVLGRALNDKRFVQDGNTYRLAEGP